MRVIPQLKTELTYSKVEHLLSQYYEDQLAKEVSKIFQEMEYRVINNLAEYYNPEVMFKAHTDLILAPIHEMHKDYYELLCKYKIREFDKSRASGKRIVERLINFRRRGNILSNQYTVLKADLNDAVSSTITKDKLFGTSPDVHENLETRTYQLSEKTLSRVDSQIKDIIVNGYEEGMGIDKVSRDIRRRFGQLKTWESVRIARTEIHNSQCLGVIKGYDDMGVEYIQWSTSRDSRVRGLKPKDSADHIHMEGEIIRMGGAFSNGLMYPGDMAGPAAEIINCRCQALPFIIPYGYIAPPDMAQFKEDDLIATLDYFNADEIVQQAMAENTSIPEVLTDEQIKEKLLGMSLEDKYEKLDKILDEGQIREWISLTDKLDDLDLKIVRYTSKGAKPPKLLQDARNKLLDKMFAYEKYIFGPPRPIPKINIENFVLDNQKVGEAHTIEGTILEKRQIHIQEKIIMSVDEFGSVKSYGGIEHFRINGYIRQNQNWIDYINSALTKGRTRDEVIRETKKIIRNMDSAIAKTPGLEQDSIIFRACDTFEGHLRAGDVSSFKGYASCSFQKESAKGFHDDGRYMLKILAPKGQKGIAMNAKNNGQKFTTYSHEHEYLLPRNQEFQVLEVDHLNKTATILLL